MSQLAHPMPITRPQVKPAAQVPRTPGQELEPTSALWTPIDFIIGTILVLTAGLMVATVVGGMLTIVFLSLGGRPM